MTFKPTRFLIALIAVAAAPAFAHNVTVVNGDAITASRGSAASLYPQEQNTPPDMFKLGVKVPSRLYPQELNEPPQSSALERLILTLRPSTK